MPLRFRKSINLGGGIRLNLSKKGIGMSAGVKGFRVGTGPRGTRMSVGIPGSGLSFQKNIGARKHSSSSHSSQPYVDDSLNAPDPSSKRNFGCINILLILGIAFCGLATFAGIVSIFSGAGSTPLGEDILFTLLFGVLTFGLIWLIKRSKKKATPLATIETDEEESL